MEKLLELQTPAAVTVPTRNRRRRALATSAFLLGGVLVAGCGDHTVHGQQVAAPASTPVAPQKSAENGTPKISFKDFRERCAHTEHTKLADGTRGPAAFIVGESVVVNCYKFDMQPGKTGMDIGIFVAGAVTVKAYPNWKANGTSQHEKCVGQTLVDDFELEDSSQTQRYPRSPICADGKVSVREYLDQLGAGTYAAVKAAS